MAKKQFKTESKRLLDLMINSIYTHREIFLRELISNASDAIDKRYYAAMQAGNTGLNRDEYEIRVEPNEAERTLTVTDAGCGMSAAELESNLGTIARSGTRAFAKELDSAADVNVIGQFGVGFYSAFMVADKVTVYSHKEGEPAAVWESTGEDGYTVSPCDYAPIGTKVVLHLKPNGEEANYDEFLQEYRLSSLIKKYSDYIRYPIRMQVGKQEKKEGSEDEYETVYEDRTLNSRVPLWNKNKNEITKDEYNAFYRDTFYDFDEPASVLHIRTEGMLSYTALLYLPKKPPFDFGTKGYKRGLKLYANGVMIMEQCEELLPEYFGFVKGLVDSPDLSLNISREMLQHDRQLSAIANNLKKKIQQELLRMQKDEREAYVEFFRSFGRTLKFGVYDNYGVNADFLKDTLLFHSRALEKEITLKEYVDAMPEGQKSIYYAAGDSLQHVLKLPQTEKVAEKGYDILCCTDDVDEFALRVLREYDGKPFASVSDPSLDLASDDEKKAMEEKKTESKALLERIKTALGDKVSDVILTDRLKSSIACLTGEEGLSVEMYKVLRQMPNGDTVPMTFRLELNPDHPLFAKLGGLDDDRLKQYAELIYGQAQLTAGLPLDDPAAFSEAVCALM
ncbi:MAG: molecular chaperone HtpG [Clostridia bacterium]|nr:molecular chaperone HtpG [Clostridia bacterium]